ncbi:MAG TPA: DUF1634 domain-containing protein [Phycisphaerae bacterium]|nr:DUF1634 domain-containing protein [Phycisphaerae bacterium]
MPQNPHDHPPAPDADQSVPLGRIERVISGLLRGGLLLSLVLVTLGVTLMYTRHPEYVSSPQALAHLKVEGQNPPGTAGEIVAGVLAGQGRAVVMLGVFVLFMTPVLRVAMSAITFLWEKDWIFAVITSLVLAALLISLVISYEL